VVITIDSNSSPDDGSRGDRLPLFSDLARRRPIDFPDLPPLPSARVGGATGGELPVRILARGSDWSDAETNDQSKTSDVLAVEVSDGEGEGEASGGGGSESRLLASIMDEIAQLGPGTRPLDGTRPLKWNHPLWETRPPTQTRPLEWRSPVSDARPLYKPRPLGDPCRLEWTHPPTVPRPLHKPRPLEWTLPLDEMAHKQEAVAGPTASLPVCSSDASSAAEALPTAATSLAVNSDPSIAKPRPDLESAAASPPCSPMTSHSMTSDPGCLKPQLPAVASLHMK